MPKGAIHSLESFGAVDGPGIRYLIFLRGCHLRCRYCHNPDTWDPSPVQELTAGEILDKAERFRSYWGKEGGITVSGGEPLLQLPFLLELFTEAKKRKINTCIDTAAEPFTRERPWFSDFERLMEVTDLLLLDIKHIDPREHRLLTGKDNANILDAARYLSEISKPIWIRHVLVPGITDKEEDLTRLRAFLDTLSNIRRIDVLPYHTLGAFKWKELGYAYSLEGVDPPSEESVERAKEILGVERFRK